MTPVEHSGPLRSRFVTSALPWCIGGGALAVYLLTLNPWVSLNSLGTVARAGGWLWQPSLAQPLTALVFLPFRVLPENWLPLAMNLFTAVCAALILALLARSVAIWPRSEHRIRKELRVAANPLAAGMVPPLVAVLVCGLQLSFWEHATSASGEMLDLLLFAYVIRALLEFKLDGQDQWLVRAAVLYGVGMANNWALVGFLPLFIAGMLGVKGVEFFKPRFLVRMLAWGMAGASLYLVLPLLHGLSPASQVDFWSGFKGAVKMQLDALTSFPRASFIALAITCLVPLAVICFRWRPKRAHGADDHPVSVFLTWGSAHVAHAALLGLIIWMALDAAFSPRAFAPGMPLLTYHYLTALVAGYCAGYLLAIRVVRINSSAAVAMLVALWSLVAALTPLFLWRNLGQVRATNGPALRGFARELRNSLPTGRSVVLSDDPTALYLLRADLGAKAEPLLLDTRALPRSEYHRWLVRRHGPRWPGMVAPNHEDRFKPEELSKLLLLFPPGEPIVYLHPSFGYFLEHFAARPHQAVFLLFRRDLTEAEATALDARMPFPAQKAYWGGLRDRSLDAVAALRFELPGPRAAQPRGLRDRLRLANRSNLTLAVVKGMYSRAVDAYAVALQHEGAWAEAREWFELALELRPDNPIARANLEFNRRWISGEARQWAPELHKDQWQEWLGPYRTLDVALRESGPVDQPALLVRMGGIFYLGGNFWQATECFGRAAELAPDWAEPKLGQARSLLALGRFGDVLPLARALAQSAGTDRPGTLAEALGCEFLALRGLGRTNEAVALVEERLARHPDKPEVVSMAAQLLILEGRLEPALQLFDRLLARYPESPHLLSNKGFLELELFKLENSMATLTRALELAPTNPVVRLNRALAAMRHGQLDTAEADYRRLLERAPQAPEVLLGLGEVAWRRGNTNVAADFFRRTLTNTPSGSAAAESARHRLEQMQ